MSVTWRGEISWRWLTQRWGKIEPQINADLMPMRFARIVFLIAGIYGLIVLVPQFFLERRIGEDTPPPITHPEFFYGFICVAIAWQVLFLILSRDPVRYRPMMIPAMLEK